MRRPINSVKRCMCLTLILIALLVQPSLSSAQKLIWRGHIPGNGQNIGPIKLSPGATYSVEVSGALYMGKWSQNNRRIINDPCYEFNAHHQPTPIPVLQNNLGINYCSQYNAGHVYRSANFVSKGQSLVFRVYDTDYRDNIGSLTAAVYLHQAGNSNLGSRAIKLFSAVRKQNSTNFKKNRFPDVHINTNKWDTTPYHFNRPANFSLKIPYGKKVYLSSRSNSNSGIYIDNFLMFVVNNGYTSNVFSVGSVPEHTYRGVKVTRAAHRSQNPGCVDLTKYFPVGKEVKVTVYALDFGGVAGMSDTYLVIR